MKRLDPYLKYMAEKGASDCYFTTGAPPALRIDGRTYPVGKERLEPGVAGNLAYEMMTEAQQADFEERLEYNLAFTRPGVGRFRVNVYRQRGEISFVVRHIKFDIPEISNLNLPEVLPNIINQRKGLILVVGSTGSGKSTTLASMVDYRNQCHSGHILTVEDPIEYMFRHQKSIVGQREVGIDTHSYDNALREAMREAPDVVMIGEVRDRATMEHAISYADTGHLCLTTLHAVNTYQALDRIINMFPPEGKNQILMDLSLNLKSVVSQRLVPTKTGGRVPAVEVMLNSPYISELIRRGELHEVRDAVAKGSKDGMQTFDQSLFQLYHAGQIEFETALDHADSRSDLEWRINFGGGVQEAARDGGEESDDLEFPDDLEELPNE